MKTERSLTYSLTIEAITSKAHVTDKQLADLLARSICAWASHPEVAQGVFPSGEEVRSNIEGMVDLKLVAKRELVTLKDGEREAIEQGAGIVIVGRLSQPR